MFTQDINAAAAKLLNRCQASGLRITTAESCTGGLIAACLTDIPGSSTVFERGFVTYSNEAKTGMLAVSEKLIAQHGAVSEPVALAMATGALSASPADLAIAVTGIAGPGGGTPDKPVGTVHIACALQDGPKKNQLFSFGDLSRAQIRMATVLQALVASNYILEM